MEKKQIRCAIYTRKSTEEGLEQSFNSLDAQRDSCEAYIKSQTHEGWKILTKHYDDGGYSGGTMNRPAFQELLKDIEQDKIDIVVVYKVDRLTRSLMDFSKIVDVFDKHNTSFVSITQHFNTTTSMGRLTLNILLSFAQFEREVTGERIRDKFAASAKKGLWITGATPLGYKKDNGALVEDTEQSWKIQIIFGKYLELKSVAKLKFYLDENEVHTRSDKKFSKGNLYHLLSNKVYIGKITKDNNIYEGKHDAIISTEIFNQVQKLLQANSICTPTTKRKSSNALLQGKIFDDKGNYFSPSRSTGRSGKIYNYYINQGIKQGKYNKTQCITRIPAKRIEDFIFNELNTFIHNTKSMQKIIANKPLNIQAKLLTNLQNFEFNRDSMRNILSKVIIDNNCTELLLSKNKLYELITSETSFSKDENISLKFNIKITQCSQKGNTMLMGLGGNYNQTLVNAIIKGFYYNKMILNGKASPELYTRNARRLRKLRFLDPKLIEQIMLGTQSKDLTVEKLCAMVG